MVITDYKDVLSRLINILNYKKVACQKKVSELDKINNVKRILTLYPDNQIKSLMELNEKDLINFFDEFLSIKFSIKDIETKKYWINEGNNNDLIKQSEQYKDCINLFNSLIDTMQMYLDFTRSFVLIKEDILNELNVVTTLIERLVNNCPITDFTPYYSLFLENETLTHNNMYMYFSAIASKNIDSLANKDIILDDLKYNIESKNYIINCIEKNIDSKEKEARENDFYNKKILELKALIDKIKNNYDLMFDYYPRTITDIMTGVWDDEDIEYYINKLAVPIALIKGKNKGLNLNLSDDDNVIIEEFIDDLNDKLNKLTIKEKEENNKEKFCKIDEISKLNNILNKINDTNDKFLSFDEIIKVTNIILEKKESHQFILETLNILNKINILKYCKDGKNLNNSDEVVENNNIDKRSVKKIEVLFNKYGFIFDSFPIKVIEDLSLNAEYSHIKNMVEYINSIDELSFLKDYTLPVGNRKLDKEIQDIKCSQICFILEYSTEYIINNLLEVSKEYNIDIHDIFSIPKVFASNRNEKIKGTFEDFINNLKFIHTEYPEIFDKIISNYTFVLGTESGLFRRNIDLTEMYGMNISKDSKGMFPSPMALSIDNFEYIVDRYIEADSFDCVEAYRSILQNNSNYELKHIYKDYKDLDITLCKKYDTLKNFSSKLEKGLQGLSVENIAVALTDSFVKELDKNKLNNNAYIFNGVIISRYKFLKYYGTFLINNYKDKREALLYSIIKDSYLTENEYCLIKKMVNESEVF